MKIGQKVVTFYFILTYLIPAIGNYFFEKNIYSIYTIYHMDFYSLFIITSTYLLFLKFSNMQFIRASGRSVFYPLVNFCGKCYANWRLTFAIICLIFVFINYYYGLNANNYRYTNESLLDRDSKFTFLIILLNTVISVDLFYSMFIKKKRSTKKISRQQVETIALAVTLLFLADGTANVFLGLLTILYSFMPNWFNKIAYMKNTHSVSFKSIIVTVLLVFILVLAWFAGESIKASGAGRNGIETFYYLANNFNGDFIGTFFYYLIERLSVYYYSFLLTTHTASDVLSNGSVSAIFFPINTFFFRLGSVLPGIFEVHRPDITSISQLNYQLLVKGVIDVRQGSSPGILGSFNYIFIFPFNILMAAIYLNIIAKMIDVLLYNQTTRSLTIIGIFLLYNFLQIFFQSPFDFLMIIDNSSIYVLLIISIYIKQKEAQLYQLHASKAITPKFNLYSTNGIKS